MRLYRDTEENLLQNSWGTGRFLVAEDGLLTDAKGTKISRPIHSLYTIVDDFKEIPYHVKDFAINVIEAGASDVEIKYGEKVIGYGTYIEGVDGSTKLRVSISTDDKIPELINVIPGTYNADLKEGSGN